MRPTVLLYFLWSAAWVIPIGASPADLPKVCFKMFVWMWKLCPPKRT